MRMLAILRWSLLAGTAFPFTNAFAQEQMVPVSAAASSEVEDSEQSPEGDVASTDPVTEPGPVAARSFTSSDFSRFAPKTALDMVTQIPGFTIQGGNDGNRGLGQANQNVLVNSQRVSGKSNDARTALSRISADAVERIDVVDGATLAIPGLSGEVANVIARSGGWGGNFEYEPNIRQGHDDLLTKFSASLSGSAGKNDITASLTNEAFRDGHWGPELRSNASGTLTRATDEDATYFGDSPKLATSVARIAANGNILNLNGSGQIYHFDRRIEGVAVDQVEGETFDELDTGKEREWNYEIGGDYEFGLGLGRLKLIGLRRQEHSPIVNEFFRLGRDPGAVAEGTRFDQTIDEAETIGRGEYRFEALGGDMQLSLEGAFNSLSSEAELSVRDESGELRLVPLPGANATVSEKRAESILTYGRPLADNLTFQLNAGGEFSEISAGDLTRSFVRPKGSLSLAWTANPNLTVNAKIERRVDQLSFFDFLASVDVSQGTDRGNNFELVPPQRWRSELQFVQKLGEWGSISPQIRFALIDDIVDSVPISPTQEALGNLDTAFVAQGILEGTILFDPLGWEGAKLDIFGTVTHSSLEDPLTGERREISGVQRAYASLELRHDIPGSSWAWGSGLEAFKNAPQYRLDQVSQGFQTAPIAWLFVENKNVAGLTVRATVVNLLGSNDGFKRAVYIDRRDGPLSFTEFREREFGPIVRFSISGNI